MNTCIGKKSTFAFFAYALIVQSLITNASEGRVAAKGNGTHQFHNDAERLLPNVARYLIGEYAAGRTTYVIRAVHKHPSPRFTELLKTFDVNIPITNPTCSHKTAELLDSDNLNGCQSLRLTDLDTRHGLCAFPDIIASSGPLAGYTILAVVKKLPNNPGVLQLLFKSTCVRRENGGYCITTESKGGALVEAESDRATLQIAGFFPPKSKYCSTLQCWQLAGCQQHDKE